jgi:hypothetical protein
MYVRQRTTKAGTISAALVESYRDGKGRPRQRLLANLYGETDTVKALAKLAAQREVLRKEREKLLTDYPHVEQFYETVTQNALQGYKYSAEERKEIDRLMQERERLLKRFATVERALAMIEKDGGVIKKHCTATPDEIQAAIKAHKEELRDAEAFALGAELGMVEGKAALRRLMILPPDKQPSVRKLARMAGLD